METNTRPLLDWLLRKHPDTPKTRAKQWILAGRVSVNGVDFEIRSKTLLTLVMHWNWANGTPRRWPAVPGGKFILAYISSPYSQVVCG